MLDNFRDGEQKRLDNYKSALNIVQKEFEPIKSNNQVVEPINVQPTQTFEPAFVGPQNVVPDNGGQSNQNTNAKVRVLSGPTPGYVPVPERVEEQPYIQNSNRFAALSSDDEPSSYINNNSAFSYVLSGVLIVVLIVLLVVVTLGILKTFTI